MGGDQVEALKKEFEQARATLNGVLRKASTYQENARLLDLHDTLDAVTFNVNQATATSKLDTIQQDPKQRQDQFGEASAQLGNHQQVLHRNREDAREIASRPDSNIDLGIQLLRDRLVESFPLDEAKCNFIGELVDVQDTERHWPGTSRGW